MYHSLKPVHHVVVKKGMTVKKLLEEFSKTGVMQAGKLGKAVAIYRKMLADKECKKFFGLAGAMIPGGMKKVITDMLEHGMIDMVVQRKDLKNTLVSFFNWLGF